jgi:hypothetical protein
MKLEDPAALWEMSSLKLLSTLLGEGKIPTSACKPLSKNHVETNVGNSYVIIFKMYDRLFDRDVIKRNIPGDGDVPSLNTTIIVQETRSMWKSICSIIQNTLENRGINARVCFSKFHLIA